MKYMGEIVLLLIFVTTCSGLRCYDCSYVLNIATNTRESGNADCLATDTTKWQSVECNESGKSDAMCLTYTWLGLLITHGGLINKTGIVRGCSYGYKDKTPHCSAASISGVPTPTPYGLMKDYFGRSCRCNGDNCNGNGQVKNVPAILASVTGFSLFILAR